MSGTSSSLPFHVELEAYLKQLEEESSAVLEEIYISSDEECTSKVKEPTNAITVPQMLPLSPAKPKVKAAQTTKSFEDFYTVCYDAITTNWNCKKPIEDQTPFMCSSNMKVCPKLKNQVVKPSIPKPPKHVLSIASPPSSSCASSSPMKGPKY